MMDQEKWVAEHKSHLNVQDVQGTFRYVIRNHPYNGCALPPLENHKIKPVDVAKLTLNEASKYADAVTVACCEAVGKSHWGSFNEKLLSSLNATALGNTAYVAVHHSDPEVRHNCIRIFALCNDYLHGRPLNRGKTWCLRLNDPWFDYVLTGRKRFEGRRFAHQVKDFKIGDRLRFSHATETSKPAFTKLIDKIHHFPTFETALQKFQNDGKLQEVLPGIDTIQAGVEIYLQFVSLATQQQDGIVLIELRDSGGE